MPTRLHSPQRLSGREDFPPSGKSCDQHQTGVYGRTFSVPVATCLKNVIYQIRVSSDKIFLPVPNTHNTHSVSLDVWSFVIRQEANCNNLIPLRVRLQHCQVLMKPNSSMKDKQRSRAAEQQDQHAHPGCPSLLLAGWLWLPEKSQRHLASDKYNYSREHAQTLPQKLLPGIVLLTIRYP